MKLVTLLFLILSASLCYSQKIISNKSSLKKFAIEPVYKRGLPPNLFVDLSFKDANGNGIIESNENSLLNLKISNNGEGKAQGLLVEVADNQQDSSLLFEDGKKIYFLEPNKEVDISIPIKAVNDIKTAEHKLSINIKEHFGYDTDSVFLVLRTLEDQKPELVFSGLEIVDRGEGIATIIEDGQLQAGEMVKVKVVVQNIGQNIAKNIRYQIKTGTKDIFIDKNQDSIGDLAIGEVNEFWITVSPNKRVQALGELPIYLNLIEENNCGNLVDYKLPIALNQKPPKPEVLTVKANIEKIKKQVARFEYTSNKFTANVGKFKEIKSVAPSKTKRKNSIAVVIGVEEYKNLPSAPYANNDAEIMKTYFKNRLGVENVVIYKDEEVGGFVFDDIFNPEYGELQKAILKGETEVFVFYSGHGVPSKDGEKVFLFPSDGKVERLERQGYDINKLYTNLSKLGAKSVTVILDACFSGAARSSEKIKTKNLVATKGIFVRPKLLQLWQTNPYFSVFNSSNANETSLGFDQSATGLYTYYLCLGLQGEADQNEDHKITAGELNSYVSSKVVDASRKIFGVQTPQFHGNEDMVLLEY